MPNITDIPLNPRVLVLIHQVVEPKMFHHRFAFIPDLIRYLVKVH